LRKVALCFIVRDSYDISMKGKKRMLSPKQYAASINRPYSTVDTWLRLDKVPGAVKTEIAGKTYWEIPEGTEPPSTRGRGRPPKEAAAKPAKMSRKGKSKATEPPQENTD
jgi:hypothetical protein